MTLRSNKVIWVCILCRKKQELLIKTGQWIKTPLSAVSTPEKENCGPGGSQTNSSRFPPLQRASSLQSHGRELPTPQLRRQYSQENRAQYSSSVMMSPMIPPHSYHHQLPPQPHPLRRTSSTDRPVNYPPLPSSHYLHDSRHEITDYSNPPPPPAPSHHSHYIGQPHSYESSYGNTGQPVAKPRLSHSFAQSSHDWSSDHQYMQTAIKSSPQASRSKLGPGQISSDIGPHSSATLADQRSLSSSEEELRSTPDYTSCDELESRRRRVKPSSHLHEVTAVYHHHEKSPELTLSDSTSFSVKGSTLSRSYDITGGDRTVGRSVISGFPSTSGVESFPSPSTSRGLSHQLSGAGGSYSRSYHHNTPPERRRGYTDRRQKKTVRFDSDDFGGDSSGGNDEEWFLWDQGSAERQGSQDSTTKDSGIDSCSNFTSSEDSNRELVPTKHPVSWQATCSGKQKEYEIAFCK